ncbi:hypothetical protein MLD38_017388 [Melastoma candidum]|uniref:Uncharacterized protein n=1 Tax=Melastoma candidum TaxID=119954 RepID=A0ACB9QQG3_9MYRT|nr:hypothetical protein MLD38_017388 [Melastoma candidum]
MRRDSSLFYLEGGNRLLKDPLLADARSETTGTNVHSSSPRKMLNLRGDQRDPRLENCLIFRWMIPLGIPEAGLLQPDVLAVNCTSLSRTSEIFSKISVPINQQRRLIVQPPTCNFCNIFTGKFILFPTLLKLDSCICAKDTISLQHQQVITCSAVKLF